MVVKQNVGINHLSWVQHGETAGTAYELPDADLFRVEVVPDFFAEITEFLSSGSTPEDYDR